MSIKQLSIIPALFGVISLFTACSVTAQAKEEMGRESSFPIFVLENRDTINKQFESIRKKNPELAAMFTALYIDFANQPVPGEPPPKELCIGSPFPEIPRFCIDIRVLQDLMRRPIPCLELNRRLFAEVGGSLFSSPQCGILPGRVKACNDITKRGDEAFIILREHNSTTQEITAAALDYDNAHSDWFAADCQNIPGVKVFPGHVDDCNNWVSEAEAALVIMRSGTGMAVGDALITYNEAHGKYQEGGCANFLGDGVNVFPE